MSPQVDTVALAESLLDITAVETTRGKNSLDQATLALLQAIRQN
jgi:hypothetical protein